MSDAYLYAGLHASGESDPCHLSFACRKNCQNCQKTEKCDLPIEGSSVWCMSIVWTVMPIISSPTPGSGSAPAPLPPFSPSSKTCKRAPSLSHQTRASHAPAPLNGYKKEKKKESMVGFWLYKRALDGLRPRSSHPKHEPLWTKTTAPPPCPKKRGQTLSLSRKYLDL